MAKRNAKSTKRVSKSVPPSPTTRSRRKRAKDTLTKKVKCLACGKKLTIEVFQEDPGDSISIVYNGLICRASGNYGSAVFDPLAERINGESSSIYLEFVICDDCVRKNGRTINYVRTKTTSKSTTDRRITYEQYHGDNKVVQELWKKIYKLDPGRTQELDDFFRQRRKRRR
jgi:hypothetical protein